MCILHTMYKIMHCMQNHTHSLSDDGDNDGDDDGDKQTNKSQGVHGCGGLI